MLTGRPKVADAGGETPGYRDFDRRAESDPTTCPYENGDSVTGTMKITITEETV